MRFLRKMLICDPLHKAADCRLESLTMLTTFESWSGEWGQLGFVFPLPLMTISTCELDPARMQHEANTPGIERSENLV